MNWHVWFQVISSFARHYKTGEPLSKDIVNSMCQSKKLYLASVSYSFCLTLSMLGKNFSRWHFSILKYFSYFFQKIDWYMYFMQIISLGRRQFAWNVKVLFSGKNKKNITYMSSSELAQRINGND